MKFQTLRRGRTPQRAQVARRPRIELLENRRLLSVLGTFELDGNAITGVLGSSGSTTTSPVTP